MNLQNKLFVAGKCLKYHLWQERAPLLVSLSVTGRCNLKCPYCYINVQSRNPIEPQLKTLIQYVDDFYNLGTRIFFLQGGEPLLHQDIVKLVQHIKSKNCYCSISTNGTIHRPLPDLKIIDHLEISLDGPPDVNDQTRGKGTFQRTVEAARLARKLGIKFHFHSVLNVHNLKIDSIKFVANLAKKLGTYMTACFATASGYSNNQEFVASVADKQIKEGYRLLIQLQKQGYPIYNSILALNHALNWPISYNQIGFKENLPSDYKMRCLHGRLAAWFDHEGWLYPCTLAFGRRDFRANVNKYGIKGAWEKLAKLKCQDCGIASDITFLFGLQLENLFKVRRY